VLLSPLAKNEFDTVDVEAVLAETNLLPAGTNAAVVDASATTDSRAMSTRKEIFCIAIVVNVDSLFDQRFVCNLLRETARDVLSGIEKTPDASSRKD